MEALRAPCTTSRQHFLCFLCETRYARPGADATSLLLQLDCFCARVRLGGVYITWGTRVPDLDLFVIPGEVAGCPGTPGVNVYHSLDFLAAFALCALLFLTIGDGVSLLRQPSLGGPEGGVPAHRC